MRKPLTSEDSALEEIRRQAKEAREALDAFDATVEGFLQASSSRADLFGMAAAGRMSFVFEMRKGRDFRRATLKRALAFIENFEGNDDLRRRSAARKKAPIQDTESLPVGTPHQGAKRGTP